MASLFETLKNIGLNIFKPTTGVVDLSSPILKTTGEVLPGAKAAVESIKQGSTEPYKQFLAEHPLETPDISTKEGQQKISEMAINFTPMGLANVEKEVITKLVKEGSEDWR